MNSPDGSTPAPSSPVAKEVCVLIVDIVRSTALYEQLGNVRARETVGACLTDLSDVVARFGGRVVKSMGDGLLCAFVSPEHAVQAGLVMRDRVTEHGLAIRIGVQQGEVLEVADGDIFGDAVNTASRIADVAKPSEILITGDVRAALPALVRLQVHEVQPVMVKGKREPLELYSILFGNDTGTIVAFTRMPPASRAAALRLAYGGTSCVVGPNRAEVSIGRERICDVVVAHKLVSRRHASVHYRGGKFVLVDESANGTFLVPEGHRTIVLRREEALLHGSGRIYLGADPDADPTEAVEFRVEE
jgi:class 3 adenylate cyclase